jgi:hypothetical protein
MLPRIGTLFNMQLFLSRRSTLSRCPNMSPAATPRSPFAGPPSAHVAQQQQAQPSVLEADSQFPQAPASCREKMRPNLSREADHQSCMTHWLHQQSMTAGILTRTQNAALLHNGRKQPDRTAIHAPAPRCTAPPFCVIAKACRRCCSTPQS